MATKKTFVEDEEVTLVTWGPTTIKEVAHEFGREDLNELKDTVNSLVRAVNNLLD